MKKLIFGILTVLSLSLPLLAGPDEPRFFKNWKECFRFIASQIVYELKQDDDTISKLESESSTESFNLEEGSKRTVIVITSHFFHDSIDALRGASGNGSYYLFIPIKNGFQFVGEMEGCRYEWGMSNRRARFKTWWHMSAGQAYENIYDWDGKIFRQTSSIRYEYNPDGTRREVKEKAPIDSVSTDEDWSFMQSVGGIAIHQPYRVKGKVYLPVECDVSGTKTITIKPTAVKSVLGVRDMAVSRDGTSIYIWVSAYTWVSSSEGVKNISPACRLVELGDVPPGKYTVFYGKPGEAIGKPLHPVRLDEVQIEP